MGLTSMPKRHISFARAIGLITTIAIGGACIFEDVPACPGQCFAYTIEYVTPLPCTNATGDEYAISFTSTDPDGYRGRFCFNSHAVPLVVAAIDHITAGGQLSELSAEIQSAYVTTVNAVRADLQAECLLAAPGQCTNAPEVCTAIGAAAYAELVVEQTCPLSLAGTEPVSLAPGQACETIAADQATGSDGIADPCTETASPDPGASEGVDETTVSTTADDSGGATTGSVLTPDRRTR